MNRACPQCYGNDFDISGTVVFVGRFTLTDDDEPFYYDDDIMWDTQSVTHLECRSCGWSKDVEGAFHVERELPELLDTSVEDLPDEEELGAEVSSDTERESSPEHTQWKLLIQSMPYK